MADIGKAEESRPLVKVVHVLGWACRRKGGSATRIRPCKEKFRYAVIAVGSKLVLNFSLGAEG
jgi:hypothetical protein